jgi:hypothetical protein
VVQYETLSSEPINHLLFGAKLHCFSQVFNYQIPIGGMYAFETFDSNLVCPLAEVRQAIAKWNPFAFLEPKGLRVGWNEV